MGKRDEVLHGVGGSFGIFQKAFQRQTNIMGVYVKTNVIIGGCTR